MGVPYVARMIAPDCGAGLVMLCRRVLIDTGEPERADYLELLRSVLQQAKSCVSEILVTHWHLDHTGGIPGVRAMMTGNFL